MALTQSPLVLKNLSFTLKLKAGADPAQEYRCQLHTALISAEPSLIDYETFCGVYSTPGLTKYTITLEGFQAFGDATDLAMFLFTNDGALCTYTMVPGGGTPSDTNPGFSGDCYAVAGSVGGTVGETATVSVTLPCVGAPAKVVA